MSVCVYVCVCECVYVCFKLSPFQQLEIIHHSGPVCGPDHSRIVTEVAQCTVFCSQAAIPGRQIRGSDDYASCQYWCRDRQPQTDPQPAYRL